ncbi:hypothetical protein OG203_10525 [Nocardia sp. NBC_01499]|uniref:hypothetical protein n=1 Tax=Nocardia sp. NBC_01499 TaxID=2903597 RepID=UPI003868531B
MSSQRAVLTPQMIEYTERLYENGDVRWLPYLLYFHPADHRSDIANTDRFGFRFAHGIDVRAAPGEGVPNGPVRLLVGSSVVFGVGATCDEATLPSRLWSRHAPSLPWLNFGGRSHNSMQELLLFLLHRHLIPQVEEIVIFSGFNNLGLARLPESKRGDHGAFYLCNEYFAKIEELRKHPRRELVELGDDGVPSSADQIATATELTVRHLDAWRVLAAGLGARLSFVLQPLAPWVRERPAPQERLLFDELDAKFDFGATFGDITPMEVGRSYADALRVGCAKLAVPFYDMNTVLGESVKPDEWLFVDRAHFTDNGYDIVAGLLADRLGLR